MGDPHYSGTPSGPIPRSRVVPNGKPGDYEIHWGPVEKAVVGGIVSLLILAVGGGIAMYREMGELRTAIEAVRDEARSANVVAVRVGEDVQRQLQEHVNYSRDLVPKLLTREEYQRDKEGGR